MMPENDDEEEWKEFYNCFELEEKAVIFKCVGRGLKLPPLSTIYVHPFLLKRQIIENVRPSHHILDSLSLPQISTEEPDSNQDRITKSQHSDDIIDEDVATDEPDSSPSAVLVHNSSRKKVCVPANVVCKAECSSVDNHVVSELPNKRCFEENVSRNIVKPSLPPTRTSAAQCETDSKFLSASSEKCYEENVSGIDRGPESSSNSYWDPIAKRFSSDGSEVDFSVNHFRSFKKDATPDISDAREFPVLLSKPPQSTQNLLKLKKAPKMPIKPAKLKDITKLLFSDNRNKKCERHSSADANKKCLKQCDCRELFIENLPHNVDRQSLKNFLKMFGNLKSLVLKPYADTVTAEVQIDADLEWIVECLDGTTEFSGAESQVIRCYYT